MKTLYKRLLVCLFSMIGFSFSMAQKPNKQATKKIAIQQAIDSQSYTFHAQQALPLGGGARQLTTDYYLRVTPDSVTTYLPYFGRAYSVPYNDTEGGINVNINKFTYQKTPRNKGGWNIVIKPTERLDVQELILFVSDEGYGTLQIISVNRQAISFSGYTSKN